MKWRSGELLGLRVQLSGGWLGEFPLSEAFDSFVESVLLDQLGATCAVFRFRRELGVAPVVEVEGHNLGEPITPNVETFPVPQTFEKVELLIVELEQLAVILAVERVVRQKEKRRAGVHNAVGVLAQVVCGLADHGHAAAVLADGLDGSKRGVE